MYCVISSQHVHHSNMNIAPATRNHQLTPLFRTDFVFVYTSKPTKP